VSAPAGSQLRVVPEERTRTSPFSYQCAACKACCHDKVIHVGPYEIARLAHNRGLSTGELIERFTTDAGSVLAVRDDGACVFLEAGGCGVHADRPLVCRLYPLGRVVESDGVERFVELEPHPDSKGVYGQDGSVAQYMEAQGALPFIDAANRYYRVLSRMVELLSRQPDAPPSLGEALAHPEANPAAGLSTLDVDALVADFCQRHCRAVPTDVEAKVALHLDALSEWLDGVERET